MMINENNRKATCQLVHTFSRESRVSEVEVAARDGSRHSRIYEHEFQPIGNEEYWSPCSGSTFIPNPLKRRNRTGRPKITRIRNEMNDFPSEQNKKCGCCRTECYNRKTCSWKPRLIERFSPERKRISWEGEILDYTGGFSTGREMAILGC
ncbi:hypothetical protein Lal_00033389 [Lupinus albus]|nr:hypothetical protein Lal_00033389 [Lupinus albus]